MRTIKLTYAQEVDLHLLLDMLTQECKEVKTADNAKAPVGSGRTTARSEYQQIIAQHIRTLEEILS